MGRAAPRSARTTARELASIYRRYRSELATREREDSETFAWGALDALRERPESWGSTPVFLYGFDDLTPVELDAVETLSQYVGAAVTVSLTYEPDRPALAARASVVEELRELAQAVTQLPALDEYYAADSRAPLHHLERHLFEPGSPVLDPHDAIGLMEAGSERTEAELVAAGVLAASREGVDPQDIVVICRSLAALGRAVRAHARALRSGRLQRSPGSARAHGAWASAAGNGTVRVAARLAAPG